MKVGAVETRTADCGAEYGNAEAAFAAALNYESGHAVERDTEKAARIVRSLAQRGFGKAQLKLAEDIENGKIRLVDPSQCLGWYRRAAESGEARAMFRLGLACESGDEPGGLREAGKWFRAAAQRGLADAQCKMGGS